MKIKIDIAELKIKCADLESVIRQVKQKGLETLKSIYISADSSGKVTAAAYNLDVGMIKTLNAEVIEPGKGIIPINDLQIICKLKGYAEITLTDEKGRVEANREYEFLTEPAEDFPEIPIVNESKAALVIAESELVNGLKLESLTLDEEHKPAFMGIWIDENSMVACDGFRIGKIETSSTANQKFNLSKSVIALMKKVYSKNSTAGICFYIADDGHHIKAKKSDSIIVYHQYDGEVMNHKQIFNDADINRQLEIAVDKVKFDNSINFMYELTKGLKSKEQIIYEIDNELRLSLQTARNKAAETLPIDVIKPRAEKLEIAFNPVLVQELIKLIDGKKVYMTYAAQTSPSIMRSENPKEKYLILPLRFIEKKGA